MMKSAAVIWITTFIACHLTAAEHPPECSNVIHGRSCSLDSNAETVTVLGDRVFVGAANHIYSFGRDLSLIESITLEPEEDKFERCTNFDQEKGGLANSESACMNFIRTIQQVPSGFETNAVDEEQLLVCGTNAFFPKCRIHESASLSNFSFMTSKEDSGFSPHSNSDPLVALLASNGRFFSATLFQAFQPLSIGMAKNPLGGDSLFHVRAPTSDPLWFNRPEFVSTYEIGEHIYFFIREPAFEVGDGLSVVYSRAIRICKSDDGQGSSGDTPFLTYQKARMRCSYSGERGSIPYNYDNLESTFLWSGNGQPLTLYGIFSSPNNGPEGGAICKFSFDETMAGSLTSVFETGDYMVQSPHNQQEWITEQPGPFSCPGDTTGNQRTVEQANRYQLLASPVEAMHPEPLHVVSGRKLGKIAVDIITFNGNVQEIVYFTTESGEIRQAVHAGGSSGSSQDHVIQSVNGAVSYLSVHQSNEETRQIYATTEDKIVTISRGNCAQYSGCFECLDSKDAYCGWSMDTKRCINKLVTSNDLTNLVEAHSVSEEGTVMACGARPVSPTPSTPTINCPLPPTSNEGTATGAVCPPEIAGISNGEKTDMDIPTIVGATVGAFVLGVPVGAFVCFIFFRMFINPRRAAKTDDSLEESCSSTRQTPYDLHSSGDHQVTNWSVTEQGGDSSTNTLRKKDLSMSLDMVPSSSISQPNGLPRYVDVRPKSCLVPNGSAVTPSGRTAEVKLNKSSITGSEPALMSIAREKDDSAFRGSENDIVPPLVRSEEQGAYRKHKHSKHHVAPMGANGLPRVQIPGHRVPKGRTSSTTWLRANSVSDGSDLSSPLQSPISDV